MHDVIVANGHWHGGGMKLAPDARPDDGAVRRRADRRRHEARLRHHLTEALQRRPRPPPADRGRAQRRRRRSTRRSRCRSSSTARQAGTTPARFEVVPGALRVRVPPRLARGSFGLLVAGSGLASPPSRLARRSSAWARSRGLRRSLERGEPLLDRRQPLLDRTRARAAILLGPSLSWIAPWMRRAGAGSSRSSRARPRRPTGAARSPSSCH